MDKLYPPAVYVDDTGTERGLGVFAARSFDDGEIVELCPVMVINQDFDAFPITLQKRVFHWGASNEWGKVSAIIWGYGSLYNHADPANMMYKADEISCVMIFTTVRPVKAGEELTVNYEGILGDAVRGNDGMWFERMNVKQI